jgi:hypothetical protein
MSYKRPVDTVLIVDDTVTNVDLAHMAEGTIKGRISAGAGDPEDLTAADLRTIVYHIQEVTTTDDTQTTMSNSYSITSDSVNTFKTRITAIEGATGDVWVHEFKGSIKNLSGTTTLVDDVTNELIAEDTGAAAWSVTMEANDTSDVLDIKVTGEASHTIKWRAETIFDELTF